MLASQAGGADGMLGAGHIRAGRYRGVERRAVPPWVMTVPGTGGRMRFDGTLTIGNLLIILSMICSVAVFLVWIGQTFQGVRDVEAENTAGISDINRHLDALDGQVRGLRDAVHLIQQQNSAFARSLGAPLPPRLQPGAPGR